MTSCFQRTVLVWIPCVFLWMFALFEYRLIRKSKEERIPWAFMNGMKCGLITTLIIFQIFELTYDLFYEFKGYDTPVVDKYTPICKLVTFVSTSESIHFKLLFPEYNGSNDFGLMNSSTLGSSSSPYCTEHELWEKDICHYFHFLVSALDL